MFSFAREGVGCARAAWRSFLPSCLASPQHFEVSPAALFPVSGCASAELWWKQPARLVVDSRGVAELWGKRWSAIGGWRSTFILVHSGALPLWWGESVCACLKVRCVSMSWSPNNGSPRVELVLLSWGRLFSLASFFLLYCSRFPFAYLYLVFFPAMFYLFIVFPRALSETCILFHKLYWQEQK